MLGMANTISWTVEAVEAPQLGIIGHRHGRGEGAFTLGVDPDGSGSTSTIDAEFEGALIVGALGKAVEKDAPSNSTSRSTSSTRWPRQQLLRPGMTTEHAAVQRRWAGPLDRRRAFEVTRERLAEYAAATNDPIAAHRAGDVAPPVFAIVPVFESLLDAGPRGGAAGRSSRVVHGEQDFHFHRPIRPGTSSSRAAR